MKLIVGLGNKGKEYTNTRHNVGYDFIDKCIPYFNENENFSEKFKSLFQTININGEKIIFQKPQTYMNLSGEAIREIVNFYKLDIEKDVLVIYDDMDIDLGKFKIRGNGSSAGHNGIKSIISHLGDKFIRVKIWIGAKKNDTISHVLGKFSKEEQEQINIVYDKLYDVIKDFIKNDVNFLMNKYNRKDWFY